MTPPAAATRPLSMLRIRPTPRPTLPPASSMKPLPSIGLKTKRSSSRIAARPVAARMIRGHGSESFGIFSITSRAVTTALATSSSQGIVPVKKKSKAFAPELDPNPATDTLVQFKKPKMSIPSPPPTTSQSLVLNLLKSMLSVLLSMRFPAQET